MFNPKCKSGKKTKAARRAAAMLMTGALGASLAVTGINPGIVNVSAASWQENAEYIFEYLTQRLNYSILMPGMPEAEATGSVSGQEADTAVCATGAVRTDMIIRLLMDSWLTFSLNF